MATTHQRLYQQIAQRMLDALNSGEYPPGSRLPSERELSDRYSVSRPTIREAIIALEISGRVEVKTGSGVYVLTPPPVTDVDHQISPFELTEARVLVEGEAAALAASMISEPQLGELKICLDKMRDENNSGELDSSHADRRFHEIISEATQNRALITMINNLWNIQEGLPDIQTAHESVCMVDAQQRLNEHRDIFDALTQRDSQLARIAMRKHFSRLMDALHDTTEAKAVAEIHRTLKEQRKRFSLNRLNENLTK